MHMRAHTSDRSEHDNVKLAMTKSADHGHMTAHDGEQSWNRVTTIFHAVARPKPVPVALEAVRAGFPSVAQDYFAGDFSIDENIITNPDTTYILHVAGDSMEGAGIFDGDLLIVDRSLPPAAGDIVVAILDDELTVKRLLVHGNTPILHPENARYPDFIPSDDESLSVWGVVTGNFHSQRDTKTSSRLRTIAPRTIAPSPQRSNNRHSIHTTPDEARHTNTERPGHKAQHYPTAGWGA